MFGEIAATLRFLIDVQLRSFCYVYFEPEKQSEGRNKLEVLVGGISTLVA
jgi:hypothetical protein